MRIIVVGAGIIGLATAWRLHRDGHEVTLLDPAPAGGATHAAGGMLTPVGEAFHGEDDLTALLLASSQRYPEFVADVAAHLPEGTPTGYVTSGTLICGADAADRGHLADLHALCLRLGLRIEALTTREARRLEPLLGPRLTCAFLAPDDHQVDPRLLAAALLTALRGAGVRIVEDAATRVRAGGRPHVVTASGETLDGDAVVVAAGLGAADLTHDLTHDLGGPDLRGVLRPVHGEVIRLIAPPHLASHLTHTVRGLVEGRPVYLIPRGDGRVLLGATAREDDERRVLAGGVHDLLVDAVRLVPAVREFAVEEVLARARPGTPDNAPLVGPVAPGVLVATGLFRHGILLAPLTADLVAAHLRRLAGADRPDDADLLALAAPTDPHRFSRSTAGKDTP
ncbi:glycine oxidase ThiO [Mobilicoccus pelagius]|uniref:glycine oxidase n=1 Tax=Mobilicoccus pelagius NBRC 104925 TaxID=1089455 RepID=H5USN6_9MICO|nr:glycine oxidase ThiO [Mobilicoccus pelagius]GAB48744.1 thiamine biosynthesis oxidoreductase ThiO [Mobilicoccus pelagius NBRC 104925]